MIVRLGEKLESEAGGVGGKLLEVHRMIDRAQLVVVENLRLALHDGVHLGLKNGRLAFGGLAGLEPLHDLASALDAGVEFRGSAQVKQHHVAKHLADAAPGKRVVTDKGDAVRRQNRLGQSQQLVAHGFGHPGIDPVGDHVIESPEFGPRVHDIHVLEADIGEAEGGDFLVAGANCHCGRVEAQELGGGVLERHRDQVLAVSAAQFEDAAAMDGGGVHAEENGEGGEPVGMGLPERHAGI